MAKILSYAPKVDIEGAYYTLIPKEKGGFEFDHSGATFREYETTDGKKSRLIAAELPGATDGKPRWIVQSIGNWGLYGHNADTICRMLRKYNETAKERLGAKLAECGKAAETLKGAGLSTVEITAILKSRGHAEADIKRALKVEEVTEDAK